MGVKGVDCSKNYTRKEKSIFHNRQSCSYIIAPTETPHTKWKHPFCSNALLCLFELRGMTERSLSSSLLTWAGMPEHGRLLIWKPELQWQCLLCEVKQPMDNMIFQKHFKLQRVKKTPPGLSFEPIQLYSTEIMLRFGLHLASICMAVMGSNDWLWTQRGDRSS